MEDNAIPQPITQDEVFAPIVSSIQEVADAFRKIKNSKLDTRVILLLIRDMTNMGLSDIERVLNAAAMLDKKYLK